MFCISERIFNIITFLFMIFYCISYLCNDFSCVEPCFLFLGSIGIASFFSEFIVYVILFPHERKK
jgi:hypothetical protein